MNLTIRATHARFALLNARAALDVNPNDARALAVVSDVEIALLIVAADAERDARIAALPAWRRALE